MIHVHVDLDAAVEFISTAGSSLKTNDLENSCTNLSLQKYSHGQFQLMCLLRRGMFSQ